MPELKKLEMWALINELSMSGYLLDDTNMKKGSYEILNSHGEPIGSIDTNARNIVIYTDLEKCHVNDKDFSDIVKKYLPQEYFVPIVPEHLKTTGMRIL